MNYNQKILIIIWKWDNLNQSLYDIVYTSKGNKIIRVNESELSKDNFMKVLLEFSGGKNIMILTHNEHKQIPLLNRNNFYKGTIKVHIFGGGDSFIYYKYDRGLIDQTGDFFNNDCDVEFIDEEGITQIKEEDINVRNSSGKVKQKYFDGVWWYYTHTVRQKLFKLKEEFLIRSILINNKTTLNKREFNETINAVRELLETMISNDFKEMIKQTYINENALLNNVLNQYDHFTQFVRTEILSNKKSVINAESIIMDFRNKIDLLLNSMPKTPIYT